MEFMGIQSKEYADAMLKAGTPEKIDIEPLGTGPFQLIEYQKNSLIRYKTFPMHWAGKAKVDDLIFSITPDASQRWAKMQKGECHVIASPNPENLAAIQKDPNIKLLEQPSLNLSYMAYNTAKAPFRDVRVRRALNMAIDKKNIINLIYQDTAVLATNPIPPDMWGYNSTLKDEEFNPEQAKKLLEAAGYPDGFTTELWAMPIARSYAPNPQLMAEIIQADLAKIGVKATIKSYPWEEYGKRMRKGEHQIGLYGWISDNADPDNFLYTLLGCESASTSGFNIAKFCHLPFDNLVIEAKYVSEIKARTKLYEKAQIIFKQQAPWFTIAHSKQIIPVRKEVLNYQLSPMERISFRTVDISH
jgi:dipeptide transport system substrate-binding protein